jgi:hypothetical protein
MQINELTTALDVAVQHRVYSHGTLRCIPALIPASAGANRTNSSLACTVRTAMIRQSAAVVQTLFTDGTAAAMNSVIRVMCCA